MIELQMLREEANKCQRCPQLVANRTKVVFSDGNPQAPLMIIGEGPGATEDRLGKPFVGEAGQLLDSILQACKWTRDDVYITNTVLCRPPDNRTPTDDERANCREFLDGQINAVKPQFLLLLGSTASQTLLGDKVTALRGKWHEYKNIPVVVSFHPAFILRQPEYKQEVGKDLRMLLAKMRS
jgi:DNA polymerase